MNEVRSPKMTGEPKPRKAWDPKLLAVPLAIAIAAGLKLWAHRRARNALRTQGGDPGSGFVVRAPGGNVVVILDRVSAGFGRRAGVTAFGARLTSLDAATGKQLGTRVLEDESLPAGCWPAAPGRAWCSVNAGGLVLLETPSFASVASTDDLVAKAGLGVPVRREWRVEGDDVVVELPDGRGARVDSATLAVREADAKGIQGGSAPNLECKTTSSWKVGTDVLELGPGPRHPLVRRRTGQRLTEAPASAPTFLKRDAWPDFLTVADPSLPLVLSDSSLDPASATPLVSRVDTTPRQLWTAELGGSCQHAEVLGGALAVTTSNPSHRARSIDLETGKVMWEFGF